MGAMGGFQFAQRVVAEELALGGVQSDVLLVRHAGEDFAQRHQMPLGAVGHLLADGDVSGGRHGTRRVAGGQGVGSQHVVGLWQAGIAEALGERGALRTCQRSGQCLAAYRF